MFEQMLLPEGGTHQKRNAALVLAAQALLAAFVVLVIPGLFVLPLPKTDLVTELVAPPPPPPPPPPAAPAVTRTVRTAAVKPVPRVFNIQKLVAPKAIPQEPAIIAAVPALPDNAAIGGVPGGIPGGVPGGVIGGTVGGTIGAPPAPPAPAPTQAQAQPATSTPSQIRIGGDVQAAKLTHEVQPAYPRLAKDAHVMGTVKLSATIASNGTVKDLHVVSGNPLLVQAAVNAVKQWTYQPTILNGKPVEVLTEVDVKFTLS